MKYFSTIIKNSGLWALLFVLVTAKSISAGTSAPVNLEAKVDNTDKHKTVLLTWDFTYDTKPEYFFIYKSEGISTNEKSFKLLGKLKFKDGDYEYKVSSLKGEKYSFYVTAAYKDKHDYMQSKPSNIVDISLAGDDNEKYYLKITSKQGLYADIGKEFEYKIETQTNAPNDCPVVFELIEGPEGLNLDCKSGLMTWAPEKSGTYNVVLKAYLDCQKDVYAKAEIKITVKGSSHDKLYIKIVSHPEDELNLGETFNYILKSETNAQDSCKILYEFVGEVPDGMEFIGSSSSTISDEAPTSVTWTPEKEGSYYIAIKAYLDCNNQVSYIQKFTLKVGRGDNDDTDNNKKQYLKIVSKPYQFGDVGEEWKYRIEVKTNAPSDCKVLYKLSDDAPDGMELATNSSTMSDTEETSLTWTPEEPGTYQFWLYAALDCNEKVSDKQRIVIVVKKKTADDPCAIMKGTVSDDKGNPIAEGSIMAWRVDDKSDNSECKQVYKNEFKDGVFDFKVSKGTYVIKASAFKYMDEWFENSMGIEHATRIDAECENEYSVTFSLESKEEYVDDESATFSGNVTSADDSSPVNAIVEFIPYKWLDGSDDIKPKLSKYSTKTDEAGHYTIVVDAGEKYIAMAIPESGSGYINQYYQNASDPFEATLIDPSSSTFESVDFGLVKSEEYTNGFGGVVENETGEPIQSKLVAYLAEPVDSTIGKFTYAQITESGDDGKYEFINLLPGKYILLSIPYDKAFVPGYYNDGNFIVHKWQKSTTIEVGDSYLEDSFVLKHKTCKGQKGIAKMKGHIRHNKKGTLKLDGNKPQDTESVSGAFVYIYDSQNEVVNYCLSDNTGAFNLEELNNGTYSLLGDKAGLTPVETEVEIAYEDNLVVDIDLDMNESATGISEEPRYIYRSGINLYPVPATDRINIGFETQEFVKTITIYDLKGNRIFTENPGIYLQNHSIDLSSYYSGSYILRITTGYSITDISFKIIQ